VYYRVRPELLATVSSVLVPGSAEDSPAGAPADRGTLPVVEA
jgi:ArsR family transcriptional regulator, arsenate/arsenite/antimonite-responsive transcriptional repressor